MSSTIFRRTAVGAIAIVGALSMAACNADTASVTTNTATTPATSSSSTPPATSSAPTTPTPEATTPSESSSSSSSQAQTSDKVTPTGTNLKYGQSAVIDGDSSGKFKLTVKSLVKAPDSAYSVANVNKSSGTMYYINYDVTNLGGAKYGFHATSVNFLELRPVFDSSEKGRAGGSPLQDLPGCKKAAYDDMAVGQTASACYYYQVTGPQPTKAMWNDYTTQITWAN